MIFRWTLPLVHIVLVIAYMVAGRLTWSDGWIWLVGAMVLSVIMYGIIRPWERSSREIKRLLNEQQRRDGE